MIIKRVVKSYEIQSVIGNFLIGNNIKREDIPDT